MRPSAFRACCRISSRLQNLFCRSSEGSQCPLCSSHIFSSDYSFHTLARLSGWASKWQTGLWLSTFPNTAPRWTPRAPSGTPGSFLFCLSPLASCPISFSVARGLLAAPGSGCTARDHVEPGEGACAPRRAWEPGPYLASSDLGPTRYHPAREFIWRGCWRKPPSIRTWAYPWPDPRQDHHLVGPAWVLNQIGVSTCSLHSSSQAHPHHRPPRESLRACVSGHGSKATPEQGVW